MLTVKLIEPDGSERIWEVEKLSYQPHSRGPEHWECPRLWLHRDGDLLEWSCIGRYYVMNSAGQTVAKYDMRDEEFAIPVLVSGSPSEPKQAA